MVLRYALIPPVLRAPLLLAGAAVLATPLLLARGARVEAPLVAAAPAPMARPEAPTTRSYAYYPEQLAALSSLNAFQPVADPGRPAVAASAAPASPTHKFARPVPASRPDEAPRRDALVSVAALATPAAAPQTQKRGWNVFGVKLPEPGWPDGEAIRRQADNWRDAASNQASSLTDHIAHLWR